MWASGDQSEAQAAAIALRSPPSVAGHQEVSTGQPPEPYPRRAPERTVPPGAGPVASVTTGPASRFRRSRP